MSVGGRKEERECVLIDTYLIFSLFIGVKVSDRTRLCVRCSDGTIRCD